LLVKTIYFSNKCCKLLNNSSIGVMILFTIGKILIACPYLILEYIYFFKHYLKNKKRNFGKYSPFRRLIFPSMNFCEWTQFFFIVYWTILQIKRINNTKNSRNSMLAKINMIFPARYFTITPEASIINLLSQIQRWSFL